MSTTILQISGDVKGAQPVPLEELDVVLASVRGYLVELQESGVDELPLTVGDTSDETLDAIRTNLVFGVGNPEARLVFVGEGPGRDEDLQGEPFVGEAGKLLTKIIEAMGFKRSDVYICNVVKCRPPQNRDPLPSEIAACAPFMLRQVKAINPLVIVALGKFAAQTLLGVKTPISKLRGNFHDYHGIPLMPTFHPAALLRDPTLKRDVWDDMKQVMKRLRVEPPHREAAVSGE
jgi:DNA polymerase